MKRLKPIFISVLAFVCAVSCRNEKTLDTFKGSEFVFVGVSEELEGESVEWGPSAGVSVLDGVSNILYQPLSAGARPRFASRKGIDDNAMEVFAVWPYSEKHELVFGGLNAYLNPECDPGEDAGGLKIAYASGIGQEEELRFVNAVSYLRVTLTEEMGVIGMTLSGRSLEVLAGLAEITLANDGTPVIGSVAEPSKSVSFVSEDKVISGTFLIPLFPAVLEKGCVLEFLNSEGCQAKVEKNERMTFRRNEVVDFGSVPETLLWQKAPKVQVHGITSEEIEISWSVSSWTDIPSDFAGKYSLGLYSDAGCTEVVEVFEWDKEGQAVPDDLDRLVYVFSGLQPSTDYWIRVTDKATNASTEVIPVTTLKEDYTPSVELGRVFWSDGYIRWSSRRGEPDGYNVYVDDVKVNEELLPADLFEYHLTGLSAGTGYKVAVGAVMGDREDRSEPVALLTGGISQITTNLSPRSLSVAIENRAGGPANTVSPALYVELYQDGVEEPLFSSIVVDGLATIHGQPFVTSLALSSAKDQRPTNVTFGRLKPSTDYRFRVRSCASYTFRDRVSSVAGTDAEVTSPGGDSQWSEFVVFTTPAEHSASSGEVLFQGFDGCTVNQDFINRAVGSVPSYKAAGVAVGTLSYSSLYSWGADKWAFYPLRMAHPSSQFAQYGWITGIGGNQKYPCTTGSNSTVTAPEFLKGATAYKCNDKASEDLADWYISNSAWPYQGYIGLGTDYTASDSATDDKLAFVITEALENNLSETQTECTLSFKGLAMYGKAISIKIARLSPDGTWSEPVSVPLMNSAGTTEAAAKWPVGDNHKWHEHSCRISLRKGDRVGLATDKGGHALIDDIQIKVN